MTKINKISIAAILGFTVIAIMVAVAWSTVASNALATEDESFVNEALPAETEEEANVQEESNEPIANATIEISIELQGLNPDTQIDVEFSKNREFIPHYDIKDKIILQYDGIKIPTYVYTISENVQKITFADSNEDEYSLYVYTPVGFAFDAFSPAEPSGQLTVDTTFTYIYKPYTGNYNLTVRYAL